MISRFVGLVLVLVLVASIISVGYSAEPGQRLEQDTVLRWLGTWTDMVIAAVHWLGSLRAKTNDATTEIVIGVFHIPVG